LYFSLFLIVLQKKKIVYFHGNNVYKLLFLRIFFLVVFFFLLCIFTGCFFLLPCLHCARDRCDFCNSGQSGSTMTTEILERRERSVYTSYQQAMVFKLLLILFLSILLFSDRTPICGRRLQWALESCRMYFSPASPFLIVNCQFDI